ncbi:hypothetical protein G9A89_003875 [Geosiphon pyriformis]|nr:hypothetical protein G9A89_003875 [Geosiphon pyriformis]
MDVKTGVAVYFENIDLGLGVRVLNMMFSILAELQTVALTLNWHKIKGHSNISGNVHTDMLANAASLSLWYFFLQLDEHYILAEGSIVSGNFRHFVHRIFQFIHHAHWEVSFEYRVLDNSLLSDVNWSSSFLIWHPDLYMAAGFTSRPIASVYTYFMKALHH